jgi:hypothetical protein
MVPELMQRPPPEFSSLDDADFLADFSALDCGLLTGGP